MNKQLAHLSYDREKEWDHTKWVRRLRQEFKAAWTEFVSAVVDREFRNAIDEHVRRKSHRINLA